MHIPKQVRRRVRSEGGFTAPDPWNGNRRTEFTIEVYKMLDPHSPRGTGGKDGWFWGPPLFGIKSEIDGRQRMLPESLVELWRTHRIPPEALPRLLWQMQSSLKQGDYAPTLRSKGIQWLVGVTALFAICVVLGFASRLERNEVLLLMLTAMLIPVPVMVALGIRRARCRKQMEWALAHL